MAIKTNTTKTIERSSTVLDKKIEATKTNIKNLARKAGCANDPIIEVEIPAGAAPKDDVLYIGLNAVDFYFKRGTIAEMPLSVAEIAANTGNLGEMGKLQVSRKRDALKAAAQKADKKAAQKNDEKPDEKTEE